MSRLTLSRAGNALIWKAIQMGGVQLIYLLRLLILARLLTPDDFGLVVIATSAVGFLLAITNFGLIQALIQKEDVDEDSYNSGWTFEVTRTLFVTTVVFIAAPIVAAIFSEPRSVNIIRALAIRPLMVALVSVKVAELTRELKFRPRTILYIAEALISAVISIALAQRFGVWALVAGNLSGALVLMILSYVIAPHRPRLLFDRTASRPLFQFGRWIFLTSLIVLAGSNMLRITISRQLGAAELGLYYLAAQLAFLPASVASEVVGAVAFPLFSRLQTEFHVATQTFKNMLTSMMAFLLPACTLLFILAPALVEEVLGSRWAGTVPVIRVLTVVSIIGVFGEATIPVLKGLGQPYKVTIIEIVQSLLIIASVWGLASRFGVVGAAMAWLPAVAVSQIFSAIFMKQLLHKPFAGLACPMLAIGLATVSGATVSYTVNGLLSGVFGLALASLLGVLTTFALLWVADRRFHLGLTGNLALIFPQIFARLGIQPAENESYLV